MISFHGQTNALQLNIARSDYLQLSSRWHDDDAYLGQTRLYFVESGEG